MLARLEASEADHKETLQHQVTQARAERSDAQNALAHLAGKQQERFVTVEALRPSKCAPFAMCIIDVAMLNDSETEPAAPFPKP